MKTVALVSRKGGTGKTSLAMNLAAFLTIQRRRAAVVDLDPQGSATRWAAWAEDLPFAVESFDAGMGENRFRAVLDQIADRCDLLLIDTPPEVETPTRLALAVAHLALIPTGGSALDVWASREAIEAARDARAGGRFPMVATIPSRTISRSRAARDLPEILKALGEPIGPEIRNRAEVAAATIEGRTVRRSTAAGKEFEKLAVYVLRRLKGVSNNG